MIYFGSKLSPNLTKTDEGYLIALNVPVARTGIQRYLPSEIPVDDPEQYVESDGLVPVYREPEEVFSKTTIASFEGKPVADNHPSTPDNKIHAEDAAFYGKGHMQNIHRGTGSDADYLMADLIIMDPGLVSLVESADKREVSCGYDCDWIVENGKVYQRNITGNHVAVVARGRAGSSVAIKDEKPKIERRTTVFNLSKKVLGTAFKEAVKDMDPEDAAELVKSDKKSEKKEPAEDEGPDSAEGGALSEILKAIKGINSRLEALESGNKGSEESAGAMDELEEATKEDEHKKEEDDKSEAIDAEPDEESDEEKEKKPAAADTAVVELARKLKPVIAKIPDKATRDSAAQVLLGAIRGGEKPKGSVYGGINKIVQTNKAKAAQDEKPAPTVAEKNAAFVENLKKAAKAAEKIGG